MEVGLDLMELFENITAVEDLRHHVPGNSVWLNQSTLLELLRLCQEQNPADFHRETFGWSMKFTGQMLFMSSNQWYVHFSSEQLQSTQIFSGTVLHATFAYW